MARYNEILVGRINRFIQKWSGIKGSPPAPQLSGEVMPVIPIFNGVELRYLEGFNSYGIMFSLNAVAANIQHWRLRNPTNSGVIGVVYKLQFTNFGAATDLPKIDHGPSTADLTPTSPTFWRFDSRGSPNPSLIVSAAAQADTPIGSIKGQAAMPVNTNWEFIDDELEAIPLLPGDALQVRSNTINQAMGGTVWWRERPLEDSEK